MRIVRKAQVAMAALATVWVAGTSLPVAAAPAPAAVGALSFASPSVGFVKVTPGDGGAGKLYRTMDGGTQWSLVDPNIQAATFGFQDEMRGYALVYKSAGAGQAQYTSVITSDGGRTWYHPVLASIEDGPLALGSVAGREYLLYGSFAGAYGDLMTLASSGAKWQMVQRFALPEVRARDYFNPSAVSLQFHAGSGIAVLAYPPVRSTTPPLVVMYAAATGGRSWHQVTAGNRGLSGTVRDISFSNAMDGIALATLPTGSRPALFETKDGGRLWTRTRSMPGDILTSALDLVTAKVGYAAIMTSEGSGVQSVFLKTTDGGRTWKAVGVPH